MKITEISCTQFAGVRDSNIILDNGINVVYGKNESGKSTIVNLISRTFFQDVKLDKRSNKDFYDNYFPSENKNKAAVGDFVDGKISFETEKGVYTLSKEWGAESRCTLSTPDGVIRDAGTVSRVLKDALIYGEGVYSEMLLSSQRNTDAALKTILDASQKTDAKKEIAEAVSTAFAESNGVSVDAIEQAITLKIDEIEGKHWDSARNVPIRNPRGRWSNGLGEILKAYYIFEDAAKVLDEISILSKNADRTAKDYAEKDLYFKNAEENYNNFQKFESQLVIKNERREKISRLQSDFLKYTDILKRWPVISENIENAKKLKAEYNERNILDIYEPAKKILQETEELKKNLPVIVPTEEEILSVKTARRLVQNLSNKLCGMNLNAAVKMFGDNTVEIKSLRDGSVIEIAENTVLSEAVTVSIPGVMEMVLSPADIDVKDIKTKLAEQNEIINGILNKFGVNSLEELEKISDEYKNIKSIIEKKEIDLKTLLSTASYEEIVSKVQSVKNKPREKSVIEDEISVLCGNYDIGTFITRNETVSDGYSKEYGNIDLLKGKAFDIRTELDKAEKEVDDTIEIPKEYTNISNPENYLLALKNNLNTAREAREKALTEKATALSRYETYKENLTGEPETEFEKAEKALNEQKTLLNHWKHIYKVFKAQKENISNNPMQDIADNFIRFLGIISGGKVSSEFPESDKLNMKIYSSDRLLDYNKLSEGTKETVSLAFRLAVLNHLFPEGGGVAVFDDPFANMDADRTAKSVELIKEFAKRHQVIFLTCKEEYLNMLNGNIIRL